MPDDSKTQRTEILEWLKEGGLLVITIIGLFLYFFLSLPTTIFYARLGTTPDEVGITYASLLSGSTVEILILLILLTAIFMTIAYYIAIASFSVRTFFAYKPIRRDSAYRKPLKDLTEAEFDNRSDLMREFYNHVPELIYLQARGPKRARSFDEMDKLARRRWELLRLPVRTAEQSAELESIESQRIGRPFDISLTLARNWIQRRGRLLAAFSIVIIMGVLLPSLAFVQAGQVRDGMAFWGENAGIFYYRADMVRVEPTSQFTALAIQRLRTKDLFLLGQNAEYVILYSSATHSTLRVPPISVIITSSLFAASCSRWMVR
jgi:hypothetical protein